LAVGAAACDGGDPGPMSGQQVLDGRDFGELFFWQPRTLAFTRDTADKSQPEPQDFLVWPLDEAQPSVALSGIDWTYPDRWPAWLVGDLLLTGKQYERVYDVGNRQAMDVFQMLSWTPPAGEQPQLYELLETTAMRSDGRAFGKIIDGTTVVVGRPSELGTFPVAEGTTVGAIAFAGSDLVMLVRQKTADLDLVNIQRLNTASGALTELVPATTAADWARVTGFCDDTQPPSSCGFFGTFGCTVDEPPCPDGQPPPCLIFYAKLDPSDPTKKAAYVFDMGAGTSTKLDGVDPDRFVTNRRDHLFVWGSGVGSYTNYWNTCSGVRGSCETWPGPGFTWRPDGGAFAMYGAQQSMRIVNVADGTCSAPDPQKTFSIYQAQYSPGSDRLWWVAANDAHETSFNLWLADPNGDAPVSIATDTDLGATFSRDGQRIFISHNGESSAALGWADVNASPPVEHVLSANRGDIGVLGNRRAMFLDHWNVQDGNGELVLVDLDTGARQSLARAVTGVAVAGSNEDAGTDVAYAVRGRAASSRDGLWLTTLPP
jgi:hypothetical protein